MVDLYEINNRSAIEAYLSDLELSGMIHSEFRRAAIAIAFRSALRVAPVYLSWQISSKIGPSFIPFLRALLTSGVASQKLTPEIETASKDASNVTLVSSDMPQAAENAAIATYFSAMSISKNANAGFAAAAATHAAENATDTFVSRKIDSSLIWAETRADIKILEMSGNLPFHPLWSTSSDPFEPEYHKVIVKLRELNTSQDAGWFFWVNWFAVYRNGGPLAPDKLEKIALIDTKVWKGDEAKLNDQIKALFPIT